MTAYFVYKFLSFMTGKRHNTIKQYWNKKGLKTSNKEHILAYLNENAYI